MAADLNTIRTKIRRLTRTPSESQMSDADIDEYINTSILYDFPEHLRLFSLRTTLTFYTQPGVDTYKTTTLDPLDPLFNFKNKYVTVHPPVFIAGVAASFTQWRNVFYGQWPQTNAVQVTTILGDGTTGPFTGIVTGHPMLQNNVVFTILDMGGIAQILVDYPVSNSLGALGLPNQPQTLPSPYGQINYLTGAFTVTFQNATLIGAPLTVENIVYGPGLPTSVLYFDNTFTLRPVPDKAYSVQIEADIRPSELLAGGDVPYLEQWWQYVSLGASIKIFQDRMDFDSVNLIMPEFLNQQNLVNRTNLVQQANQRTVTIYSQGKSYGLGGFQGGWPY